MASVRNTTDRASEREPVISDALAQLALRALKGCDTTMLRSCQEVVDCIKAATGLTSPEALAGLALLYLAGWVDFTRQPYGIVVLNTPVRRHYRPPQNKLVDLSPSRKELLKQARSSQRRSEV